MDETRTTQTTDHLGRDDKDFAIEFGEYMASAALRYMVAVDGGSVATEEWRALNSAIYEFRKRAKRATT